MLSITALKTGLMYYLYNVRLLLCCVYNELYIHQHTQQGNNTRIGTKTVIKEWWQQQGNTARRKTGQQHQKLLNLLKLRQCRNCYHFQEFSHCSCRNKSDVITRINRCSDWQKNGSTAFTMKEGS